jgi:type III secretion protein J
MTQQPGVGRDGRARGRSSSGRTGFGAVALALVAGCAVPVAAGLDEGDANRVVVALDHASIEASKEADPTVEGKFRVMVTRDDAARALGAMRSEDLPRPHAPGVMDTLDKGALVPSAAQEHAQLVAGMAGDFARTLEGVDGVLSARVHLNVAAPDPLRLGPVPRTTASVLLEHRGVAPPLTEAAVARLVAGGVPDLALTDVAVVFVPRPAPAASTDAEIRHVGPIAVARASMRLLQAGVAGLLLLVVALVATSLALYGRLRRAQRDQRDERDERDAEPDGRPVRG